MKISLYEYPSSGVCQYISWSVACGLSSFLCPSHSPTHRPFTSFPGVGAVPFSYYRWKWVNGHSRHLLTMTHSTESGSSSACTYWSVLWKSDQMNERCQQSVHIALEALLIYTPICRIVVWESHLTWNAVYHLQFCFISWNAFLEGTGGLQIELKIKIPVENKELMCQRDLQPFIKQDIPLGNGTKHRCLWSGWECGTLRSRSSYRFSPL